MHRHASAELRTARCIVTHAAKQCELDALRLMVRVTCFAEMVMVLAPQSDAMSCACDGDLHGMRCDVASNDMVTCNHAPRCWVTCNGGCTCSAEMGMMSPYRERWMWAGHDVGHGVDVMGNPPGLHGAASEIPASSLLGSLLTRDTSASRLGPRGTYPDGYPIRESNTAGLLCSATRLLGSRRLNACRTRPALARSSGIPGDSAPRQSPSLG